MKTEYKTAITLIAGVGIAVAILTIFFSTLETDPLNQVNDSNIKNQAIDKSRFKTVPELEGISGYVNTSPEELQGAMKGKVVLYDVWTYSCINCIRTLPFLTSWHEKYSDEGLLIIGIHSPEFEFEKDINNVQKAVDKYGIKYPVVLDNDKKIWKAFGNRFWPTKYIADPEGYIRYSHIGEGAYDETEKVIQDLLKERATQLGLEIDSSKSLVDIEEFEHTRSTTPELYFGYDFVYSRNFLGNPEGFNPGKDVTYIIPQDLKRDFFYLSGTWTNLKDSMKLVSDTGSIVLPYFAKQVNIVAANNAELTILLDGESIKDEFTGSDVHFGKVTVSDSSLYNIVDGNEAGIHTLEIIVNNPGFEIFTFTFG